MFVCLFVRIGRLILGTTPTPYLWFGLSRQMPFDVEHVQYTEKGRKARAVHGEGGESTCSARRMGVKVRAVHGEGEVVE